MFKFKFADYKSFLSTCENTYKAIDEHCVTCENAMSQMYASGFSGYSATAADIKFINWYDSAYNNSVALGLLHALGVRIHEDASSLKNTSEKIPASIGASSLNRLEWTSSEITVEGSANSLVTKVQSICDIEIDDMKSTLDDIAAAIFAVKGTEAILEAVDSMRTVLDDQKTQLKTLKSATTDLLLGVTDFESSHSAAMTEWTTTISLENPETRRKLFEVISYELIETGFSSRSSFIKSLIESSYADDVQKVLSRAGIVREGAISVNGRYANLSGYRLANGQAPTRVRLSGSQSATGRAILDAQALRIEGAQSARLASGAVRVGGRMLGVVNVGMAVFDGYNRSATATGEERVIHAVTEGTIAVTGIAASAGIGALVGSSFCPVLGTVVGIAIGATWGAITYALEETKDENGISQMEHIDNTAVDILTNMGQSYSRASGYGWYGGNPEYLFEVQ